MGVTFRIWACDALRNCHIKIIELFQGTSVL
jgi:hypothetical protein